VSRRQFALLQPSLGTLLTTTLLVGGWASVLWQSHKLESATIETYQNAQLEVVRNAARAAQTYMDNELERRGTADLHAIEQEVLRYFVKPIRIGTVGDAWIYTPEYAVFDESEDFPADYIGKSMAEIFALQASKGARHYEAMTEAVMAGKEGVGWYVWEPDKARAATPWWEPLSQDAGIEIAAWSPVIIAAKNNTQQVWVIGMSAMLPELMQANSAYSHIQTSLIGMGMVTLFALLLLTRLRQQDRALQHGLMQTQTLLQAIDEQAHTDFLTGLANRRQLYRLGTELLAHQTNPDQLLALLFLDLNEFKTVNDTLGHDSGDALLIALGKRLNTCLREQDLLARLGGDEFAILLHPTDEATALRVAERILDLIQQPFCIQDQLIKVGGSLGIVLANSPDIAFSRLLTQADIAMYRAKAKGNHQLVVFNQTMQAAVIARSTLEKELRQALDQQELCLYYQPIFNLQNHQPSGFEALLRWQHPHRGLLHPGEFLTVAADMGLSHRLDRWVLQQACEQLAQWHPDQLKGHTPTLSVNLCSTHFTQPDLVPYLQGLIQTFHLNPGQLTLEITEKVMIQHPESVIDSLRSLRQIGLRVSLDDFGTGYSSLNYLHQFPVDLLKIDRSFVHELQGNRSKEKIIRAIIDLAQSLGMRTVAEGIEEAEQLAYLRGMCCHYGQGNYFSKPLNATAATALLTLSVQTGNLSTIHVGDSR
jgi:diguanylate cyclase (GGDEF)-like protein